jgi:hypothetical protein
MTTVPGLGRATAGGGVLLERDRELESLDRVVQAARAGEAVMAVIEGPAGIGKSSLLARAREMAGAGGFRVLSARGSDLERELPYGIVRQLFEPLLLEPDGRERLLTGSAQAAGRVFEPPEVDDAVSDGFGALHGLFWLTANLAARSGRSGRGPWRARSCCDSDGCRRTRSPSPARSPCSATG